MALIPIEERLFRMDGETPVLRGSRCAACGKSFFPERRLCPICLEPVSNVEVFVGYRWISMEASGTADDQVFEADLVLRGWFAGGGLRF